MNRSSFIAASSAVIAAMSLPIAKAAPVTPEVPPLEYGALKMWNFDGGYPWVIAKDAEEATALALGEDFGFRDTPPVPTLIPAGEHFTMIYDDGVPEGFESDSECECDRTPGDEDEFVCECYRRTQLTLPAATWASDPRLGVDRVIWEYE